MGEVYNGINEGRQCAGVFIGIMKAFDTVDDYTVAETARGWCERCTTTVVFFLPQWQDPAD